MAVPPGVVGGGLRGEFPLPPWDLPPPLLLPWFFGDLFPGLPAGLGEFLGVCPFTVPLADTCPLPGLQ